MSLSLFRRRVFTAGLHFMSYQNTSKLFRREKDEEQSQGRDSAVDI
jgi:hypothetical protein